MPSDFADFEPEPTPAATPGPPILVPEGQSLPEIITFAGITAHTREVVGPWPQQIPSAFATGGCRIYAVFDPSDTCRLFLTK